MRQVVTQIRYPHLISAISCMVQARLSYPQRSGLRLTYRIQLFERPRKTIIAVLGVEILTLPQSALQMRNSHSLGLHGQKRGCYVGSNTGNALENGRRTKPGWMCLL